jgi:hypothetical protein
MLPLINRDRSGSKLPHSMETFHAIVHSARTIRGLLGSDFRTLTPNSGQAMPSQPTFPGEPELR